MFRGVFGIHCTYGSSIPHRLVSKITSKQCEREYAKLESNRCWMPSFLTSSTLFCVPNLVSHCTRKNDREQVDVFVIVDMRLVPRLCVGRAISFAHQTRTSRCRDAPTAPMGCCLELHDTVVAHPRDDMMKRISQRSRRHQFFSSGPLSACTDH